MIFYFSGTGNTRWAAEHLAAATGERLLFIPDELRGDCRYTLAAGERIGFCFPTHGWQPPRIVREFIRRLGLSDEGQGMLDEHYCYALTTCGDNIGRTMEILNKELAAAGLHTTSVFSLTMPESYVCLPFMYTDKPAREREKIEVATHELGHYTGLIVRRVPGQRHTQRGLTPWLFSHVFGAYFNARMITDGPFMVAADRCIHCGLCAQVCPTGDVALEEGLPRWHHDGSCTNCLACYHHCPEHAINYGKITRRREQYYFGHPMREQQSKNPPKQHHES